MKIVLTNFGCWKNNTFEFNDTGFNLLSGKSGVGKSTILRAIAFALFGVGTKVVTDGSKSCKVELWFRDLRVIRTKGPGRLLVNDHMEDAEAQAYLQDRVGELLMVYLEQNGRNTFVSMNPSQKLEFLEKLTFSQSSIKKLKERLHAKLKSVEYSRISLDSRLGMVSDQLNALTKPSLPKSVSQELLSRARQSNASSLIEQNERARDALNTRIQEMSREMEEMRIYQQDYARYVTLRDTKVGEIDSLKKSLRESSNQLSQFDPQSFDTDSLVREIQNIRAHEELNRVCNTLSQQESLYSSLVDTKRIELETTLNSLRVEKNAIPYTRKEVRIAIKDRRLYDEYMNATNHITEKLLSIEEEFSDEKLMVLEDLRDQCQQSIQHLSTSYACPSCHCVLQVRESGLIKIEDTLPTTNVKELRLELKRLDKQIAQMRQYQIEHKSLTTQFDDWEEKFDTIPDEIGEMDVLESYYERLSELKTSITACTQELDSLNTQFESLTQQIDSLNTQRDTLQASCFPVTRTEDELQSEMNARTRSATQYEELLKLYATMKDNLQVATDELQDIESFTTQSFSFTIEEFRDQMDQMTQSVNTHTKTISQLYTISDFLRLEKEYSDLIHRKVSLEEQVGAEKTLHGSCVELKQFISRAEAIAIQLSIDSINVNVQSYLDAFFVDEPLTARIISTVVGKSAKQQLSIEVIYKGMNIDLKMLSGGEYDRVVLAFAMSIMELSQSPISLFDECISSLDQESADLVCDHIQKHSKDKCTIFIAHQIVSGLFDSVVELKK